MNTLNAPIVANTALLLLGYLDMDSKLYCPEFGDESLGWLPPYTFKGVCLYVCTGTCRWVYCDFF